MPIIKITGLNLDLVLKPNVTNDIYPDYFNIYNEDVVRTVIIDGNVLREIHPITQKNIPDPEGEEITLQIDEKSVKLRFNLPKTGPLLKISLVQYVYDRDQNRYLAFYQRQSITSIYGDEENIPMILRSDLREVNNPNIYGYITASGFDSNTSERKNEVINALKIMKNIIISDKDAMQLLQVPKHLESTRYAPIAVRLNGADFDENGQQFVKKGGKTWNTPFGLHPQSFFTLRTKSVASNEYYEKILKNWLCQHNIDEKKWINEIKTTTNYHDLSAIAYVVTVFCSSSPYVTDFKYVNKQPVDIDCYLFDDLQGDCEDAAGRALYFIMDIYQKGLRNEFKDNHLLTALFEGLKRLGLPVAIAGTAHNPHFPSENGSNHMYAALLPINYFVTLFPVDEWHQELKQLATEDINHIKKATYIEGILLSTPFHHEKKHGDPDIESTFKMIHNEGFHLKPCHSNLQRPYFLDHDVEICHESLRCFSPVLYGNISRVFKDKAEKNLYGIKFKDLLTLQTTINAVKTANWSQKQIESEQKLLKWFSYPLYVDNIDLNSTIVISRHHVIKITYNFPKPPQGYKNYIYLQAWEPLPNENILKLTQIIRKDHPKATNCFVYNNLWGYKYIWWIN